MINSPAEPPAGSKKLPDFEEFAREMKRHLTLVPESELPSLLNCLYGAAKAKVEFEDYRRWAQEMAARSRKIRNSMQAAGKALSKALGILESAKTENQGLGQIEWIRGDFKFNFEDVTRQVKVALETVEDSQAVLAAMIHPHLRAKTERRSVKKLQHPNLDDRSLEVLVFPARERSPKIDHWFIGAAAECLDKYRTGTNEKIPRHDKVICELFKVAFPGTTGRNEENIRRELGRQRKCGRPTYHLPGRPIPGSIDFQPKVTRQPTTPERSIENGAAVRTTIRRTDLGQKSPRPPSRRRKMFGQKRNK